MLCVVHVTNYYVLSNGAHHNSQAGTTEGDKLSAAQTVNILSIKA